MAYTFACKKGQRIVILDEKAMLISLIELSSRKHSSGGGINSLKISMFVDGQVTRQNRTRCDGEQFEVGEVVFSINADTRPHRAALTLEKQPHYLQVARHENYIKAMNG